MAILRPALAECDRLMTPLNEGERRVAEKLSELDDDWTVYIQPRLTQDIPDFVAVHARYGVCAIEVKDWAYNRYRQRDDGSIEYVSGGVWRSSDEVPRHQAYRYLSTIYQHHFALPDDPDTPMQVVRAIVLLPNYTTAQAERLLQRHRVTEHEHSVRVLGGDALSGPAEEIVRGVCGPPKATSIVRLHRQLAESDAVREFRKTPPLSEGARNIANNPSNARRRRVRGPAGCGKSFGLAVRAARLASERKRVLVLTYNSTLANYLRTLVDARCKELQSNSALVTCTPFHAFCVRLLEDAEHAGHPTVAPDGAEWFDAAVARARAACEDGFERRFDAVLVDEGQDFTLEWWNLLREHIVTADGEMLLVADPTQDVYGNKAWTDEERMVGAGFSGTWTELTGSYRMPSDLVPLANAFAERFVDGERLEAGVPDDQLDIAGSMTPTRRTWINVSSRREFGPAIGHEVVRLLTTYPDLNPSDLVFLCEHHDDGLAAVTVIEAAGFEVHHIFAKKDADRSRRKNRFWPDSPGVKGCTVLSFKGWETPALVMGIDTDERSRRLAYVSMTRVKIPGNGRPAFLSVINRDLTIASFQSTFEKWSGREIPVWAPPLAEARVR